MNEPKPNPPVERILFVTGRLAERQVREQVESLSRKLGFNASVHVVGISVAALLHAPWLLKKLEASGLLHDINSRFDRVILPGWCQGDLRLLTQRFGVPFELGPREIHDLPQHFGQQRQRDIDLSRYDVEILAEINHAPHLSWKRLLEIANGYRLHGADVIDLGCIPGESWQEVGEAVKALKEQGHRVSIDSFDRDEVEAAVKAGAELVLSCNSTNVGWVADLPVESVVIPDDPRQTHTLWHTTARMQQAGRKIRVDPILEPVGFGFAESLGRYYEVRRHAGDLPLMMGIGNVTELTEVDSAGVQFLLAAICQELRIHSVLTTEVIHWCRGAVKEFDVARRLAKHAIDNSTLPKRVNGELVMLRAGRPVEMGEEALQELSQQLQDANYRIFVERGQIHVMNRDGYWRGNDPFELFEQFSATGRPLDASHAFYLGYELSKAVTALTLDKRYIQDEALHWGWLTVPETKHRGRVDG